VRPPQQGFQFFKVHARAKSLACARQYDHLRGRFLDLIKSSQQLFDQRATNGIALLRTIERNGGNAGIKGELNCLIFHVGASVGS